MNGGMGTGKVPPRPAVKPFSAIGDDVVNAVHHSESVFDVFHLSHIQDTDRILYPTDAGPLGVLSSRRFNNSLGIMSGSSLSRGKRPYMEDLVCNVPVVMDELEGFDERPSSCFFGVFDGHGGCVSRCDVAHCVVADPPPSVCSARLVAWARMVLRQM